MTAIRRRTGGLAAARRRDPGARRGRGHRRVASIHCSARTMAGSWSVVLVDDNSSDGTADGGPARRRELRRGRSADDRAGDAAAARMDRQAVGAAPRRSRPRTALDHAPEYLLLTDADIVYAAGMLGWLVAHAAARSRGAGLLHGQAALRQPRRNAASFRPSSSSSRCCIRSAWVNRADRATAAAAGGCMLVRADKLAAGRRHRGDPRCADRRLRARAAGSRPRADLARPDRARHQHPQLSGLGATSPQHGVALGLCAARLFAAG